MLSVRNFFQCQSSGTVIIVIFVNVSVIIMFAIIANQESRVLKFWFSPETEYFDRVTCAYEFFKELVRPENFPRGNYPASSYVVYICHLCSALILFVTHFYFCVICIVSRC